MTNASFLFSLKKQASFSKVSLIKLTLDLNSSDENLANALGFAFRQKRKRADLVG